MRRLSRGSTSERSGGEGPTARAAQAPNPTAAVAGAVNGRAARIRTTSGIEISAPFPETASGFDGANGAVVAVRPEVIGMWPKGVDPDVSCDLAVPGRILARVYLGDQTEFNVKSEELGEVRVRASKTSPAVARGLGPGDEVVIGWRQATGLALADS